MALKALLESLDNVPEEHQSLYIEKDLPKVGKRFILDIEGDSIRQHPSVSALSNAFERQKQEKTTLQNEVTTLKERFEGLPEDFDASAYETLRTKAEGTAGNKDLEAQLETARAAVRDKLTKDHEKVLKAKDDRLALLEKDLNKTKIDDGLNQALLEAGVAKEFLPAARALLKERGIAQLKEEDGTFTAVAKTDLGDVSLKEFAHQWVQSDEGKIYVPKAAGGDANGSGSKKAVGTNPFDKKAGTWNLTEQSKLLQENPVKAKQLADAVGYKIPTMAVSAVQSS